ncbi:MAG: protein phosphatase 2C domain-containing protein [Myxococcota bacterium]
MRPSPFRLGAAGDTRIGRREHDEDGVLVRADLGLFAVADGAGGHASGRVASRLTLGTIVRRFEASAQSHAEGAPFDVLGLPAGAKRLSLAVHAANAEVVALASKSEQHSGMASTVVAIYVETARGLVHVAHVGDSRCYRLRGPFLELLTQDHSLANDVLELTPHLPEARARELPSRVVTRALGMEKNVRVSLQTHAIDAKDRFLLCSDGLTDELDEEQIAAALQQTLRPDALVKLLFDVANADEAADNAAALVVDVKGEASRGAPAPALRERRPRGSMSLPPTPEGRWGDEGSGGARVDEGDRRVPSMIAGVLSPGMRDDLALHRCPQCGAPLVAPGAPCEVCGYGK